VSKRHQHSRRKAYGRRQHELHERYDRHRLPEHADPGWRDAAVASPLDPLSFLDPRLPRLRFALGD
jgi:hypothetical protein